MPLEIKHQQYLYEINTKKKYSYVFQISETITRSASRLWSVRIGRAPPSQGTSRGSKTLGHFPCLCSVYSHFDGGVLLQSFSMFILLYGCFPTYMSVYPVHAWYWKRPKRYWSNRWLWPPCGCWESNQSSAGVASTLNHWAITGLFIANFKLFLKNKSKNTAELLELKWSA